MKKLYFILLTLITGVTAFAQTIYSENMGTPTGTTAIATYVTGTAPATFQNGAPIVYTGTADMRATTASTGYTGASGGGNVFITNNTDRYFQIDGLNTSAATSENLQLSFGHHKSTAAATTELKVEVSTNGTDWTQLTYTREGGTGWALVTIGGGVIPSSNSLSLKFSQTVTTPQFRLDDIKIVNTAASCSFVYGAPTTLCDAVTYNIDTYTATVPFTGAGNGTYTVTASSGTIGGDDPTSVAAGNIIVSGVNEGVTLTVTVNGNNCTNEQLLVIPQSCKPINALPLYDGFIYNVDSNLGDNQYWSYGNTGDEIVVVNENLSYTGITPIGNSVIFGGLGKEAVTVFTSTSSGKIFTSFLMKVTDISGVTDAASTAVAVFTDGGIGNYRSRIFTKKVDTQYQLGLDVASTTTNFASELLNVNDVVFVVMGYDYDANLLKLWINPTVSTFDESVTPSASLTPGTALSAIGGFLLRQDNASTPNITFDELRVGTSVENVVLGVQNNMIEGFSMYPNPVKNQLFINTTNNLTKNVIIFDVLGKQVVSQQVAGNSMNLNLNTGIYIIKVEEAGKTATQKLVIE